MHRLAWLSKAGSFVWRRRLAASKALKRFNVDALLDRRTDGLAPCMLGPFEPVFWACGRDEGFLYVSVESTRNAVHSAGPYLGSFNDDVRDVCRAWIG